MSVALLPIGLIAVLQTYNVVVESERLAREDILARTTEAARAQLSLIEEASGAASALGNMAVQLGPETSACSDVMRRFVESEIQFVFSGFIERDGRMRCVSSGSPTDFSEYETWKNFIDHPRPMIVVNQKGTATGRPVMIVSVPVVDEDGNLAGAASISIPHSLLDVLEDNSIESLDIAITDGAGNILSASVATEDGAFSTITEIHPNEIDVEARGTVVENKAGEQVSVVPIQPFGIFIVGTWSEDIRPLSVSTFGTSAPLFPVVMWIASLFVAVFALDRLVLRHLKTLRRKMRSLSIDNLENSFVKLEGAPTEISEIGESYNSLLRRIASGTAALAENAREKDVLLKEVHHRVKNNLQLIASILNMQLRQIHSPSAQTVLKRVQQRVMSLAAIHKLLYTDTKVDSVRADLLLSEIIGSVLNMGKAEVGGPTIEMSLEPVELGPDQAVPLALLVTEAITNALKYVGSTDGSDGAISLTLNENQQDLVVLEVCNTVGEFPPEETGEDGTGLGSKLISAFIMQLEGTSDTVRSEERYKLSVSFPKQDYSLATAA